MHLQNKFQTICFLLVFPIFAFGQYFPSKNYSTTDGLPNNAVRSLFLDTENVLWIGTENGVSRLENGNFSTFDMNHGLAYNSCWDITQDSDGNMWFASYGGGVSMFDGKKFLTFTSKNGLPSERVRKVYSFKNKMYVGTELGVSIIDIKSHTLVTPKGINPHFGVFIVTDFFVYRNEVYFSAVNEGFFKIDQSNTIPTIVSSLSHQHIYSFGVFGNILYASNDGFIDEFTVGNIVKGVYNSTKLGQSTVWQYAKDKRNVLYAAAWGVYTPDGGLYTIAEKKMINISDYYGIDSKNLLNVVYDKRNDILYVGSKDKGIYEVRLDKMIDYSPFKEKEILGFEEFYGKRVLLHQEGISIINSKKEISFAVSLSDFKKAEVEYVNKYSNQLPKHKDGFYEINYSIPASAIEFYEILKHDKSIWVSSNIGIFEINERFKIIAYVPLHSYKFCFAKDGKFIETVPYAGVHLYDDVFSLKGKHFSQFEKNTPVDIVKTLNHNDKTYLISVFKGLFVYEKDQFKSFLASGIWKEKKIKQLTINYKGQLILAAEFGNVFVIDDSDSFKILKTIYKNEIVGSSILFLEAYKDFILIGTEKGINVYRNGVVRMIDKEQGLNDCAVNTSHIFDDQLWLGTKKGYYTINLKQLVAEHKTVSNIDITKITVNNIPINSSNYKWFIYNSKDLNCDFKHNSFSIDFLPKGHLFPNKLKFRYRLNSSNRWSPYSDKTNLFLPYLPYGKYDVELEVFDSNAGKSTFFQLLKIQVSPPFWFSWWFILVVLLSVFGLLFYWVFRNKKKAKDKASIQKRIVETKLEALLSQMNPHFMFNAMNAIQNYIISNDVDNSLVYVGEFAKLMRKTLENSSKQTISIGEEIDYLKSYITIENMRFDNRIAFDFQIEPSVDEDAIEIPAMLLQPFVENVFVHAFDKSHSSPRLIVSFDMVDDSFLECKIIDNGKGLVESKASNNRPSKGIHLAKERLTLLKGTAKNFISIVHTKNKGTIVSIRLKV